MPNPETMTPAEASCPFCEGHGHTHAPVYDAIRETCRTCQGTGRAPAQPAEQYEVMTPAEALLRLAALGNDCPGCESCPGFMGYAGQLAAEVRAKTPRNLCGGTGKVPVLDLREPCPCSIYTAQTCEPCWQYGAIGHGAHCLNCQGRDWLPKQGRDALYAAMAKDGWKRETAHDPFANRGWCRFWKFSGIGLTTMLTGEDADDWQAAVKAMRAAGSL